jgi:hypothetical protein
MNLKDMMARIGSGGAQNTLPLPEGWVQGRTAFGGLSSALAYGAAKQSEHDLPPLRSAQIAFTGPLFGTLTAETRLISRGKSTAFIQSEISGDQGLGLHCCFVFAKARPHDLSVHKPEEPPFPPLPVDADLRSGPASYFTSRMEFVGKRIDVGHPSNRLTRWMRLKERDGLDPVAEILCMGDSLPPSIMNMMDQNAMVSSVNWQVNILATDISTDNGWWLIDSVTHDAHDGASSQYMSIWNSRRQIVATGMQSVVYY